VSLCLSTLQRDTIFKEIMHFGGPKARKFSGLAGAGAARGADARQMVTFHYFSHYRP
jgi:hypothetical protein